jgi:hypothetical protein
MQPRRETLCFSCGQPVGDPPQLHDLADGSPCLRCADRVLESLPPLLPKARHGQRSESDARQLQDSYDYDIPGADYVPEEPPEPA